MEAGEGCACVERDPQPFGDARGGRRFEPWERTISLLQCKEKSNQVCKVRRFGIPANMAGFSSIPRAHMTPSTPVAARTCAASARERTSPLAKTGIRTAWEIDGAGGDSWKSLLFRKAVTHWHNRQDVENGELNSPLGMSQTQQNLIIKMAVREEPEA